MFIFSFCLTFFMPFIFFKIHVHSFFFFEKKTAHPPVPMNDLPPEVLAHIIACLRPPDPALLRLRAVGRKWWRAVPFGDLVGIKKETAEWLLGGKVVEWSTDMNSHALTVFKQVNSIGIHVQGKDILKPDYCVVKVGTCCYIITKYNGGSLNVMKEDARGVLGKATRFAFPEPALYRCCCHLGNTVFFLTANRILKMDIEDSSDATIESFNKIHGNVWMQLEHPFEMSHYMPEDFSTCDGKNFWVLTWSGSLSLVEKATRVQRIAAENVKSHFLVDNGVVYLQENVIKVLSLKGSILFSVIVEGLSNVTKFCVVPNLSCIWVVTGDTSVQRKGGPFLLPSGEPMECVSGGSLVTLGTKLAIAERKVVRRNAERFLDELNALRARL